MKLPVKNILFLGLSSALLMGCVQRDKTLYRYEQKCLNYGFSYGSDEFSRCMLEQERMDQKERLHQEHEAAKHRASGAVRVL